MKKLSLIVLLKLNIETGTQSYDDTSAHWAYKQGYIEAVTASKLMEGTDSRVFDPDGNVTLEQLAATLVRGLRLQPAAEPTMKGQVSGWAKGYVSTAVFTADRHCRTCRLRLGNCRGCDSGHNEKWTG